VLSTLSKLLAEELFFRRPFPEPELDCSERLSSEEIGSNLDLLADLDFDRFPFFLFFFFDGLFERSDSPKPSIFDDLTQNLDFDFFSTVV
jgi:hypothetical protein